MSEEVTGTQDEQSQGGEEHGGGVNYKDFINEDGSFTDAFYSGHPTELGGHSVISRYKTFDDLANGQINASQTITTKVDEWLGSDKEEHIKARLAMQGVPSSADDYTYTVPEDFQHLPEESQSAINQYFADAKAWAFENEVPTELFNKWVEHDLQQAISIQQEQVLEARQAFEAADGELKKAWGNNYDNNVTKAENMAKLLNMDSIIPVLKENPEMLKSFYDGASKMMSDDKLIELTQNDNLQTSKDKIAELDQKMMSYRGSTNDPEYQMLVNRKIEVLKTMPKSEEDFKVLS